MDLLTILVPPLRDFLALNVVLWPRVENRLSTSTGAGVKAKRHQAHAFLSVYV